MNSVLSLIDSGDLFLWAAVGVFSVWGGLARYLTDRNGWSWSDLGSQVIISGFTGCVIGFYSYEEHDSPLVTVALSGLGGFLGSSLLHWLWKRISLMKGGK